MPDIIDRAAEIEQQNTERAIAKSRQKQTACSAHFCEDCGEPIPELRREMAVGCTRCVDCQTLAEKRAKGFRQ